MDEQRWRGSSLTERSAQRRSQLLEAGLALVGSGGGRALTVRSLCREAGLSAKYFYESFSGRDQFMGELYDSVIAELAATGAEAAVAAGAASVTGAVPAVPAGRSEVRVVLADVFLAAVRFLQADTRRARIVLTEPLVDDELRDRARRTFPGFVYALAPEVGIRFDTGGSLRESLPLAALGGALLLTFVTWLEGGTGTSEQELADFCADLVLSSPGVRVGGDNTSGASTMRNSGTPRR